MLIISNREKWIRGAILDVFRIEPLPLNHPLRQKENVVITPHISFFYNEFFDEVKKKKFTNKIYQIFFLFILILFLFFFF